MTDEKNEQESGYNTTDAATDASSGCLFFGSDFDLGCITEALGCVVMLSCLGGLGGFAVSAVLWMAS